MHAKPKTFPLSIATLLALFIVFLAWSARQATTDGARITDRDYYSKGLRYNDSQVERKAAMALGWQIGSSLEGRMLTLVLSDSTRQPVAHAEVILTLLLPGQHRQFPLREVTPGSYRITLPADLGGEVPARCSIQAGGARLERQMLINLPAPGRP